LENVFYKSQHIFLLENYLKTIHKQEDLRDLKHELEIFDIHHLMKEYLAIGNLINVRHHQTILHEISKGNTIFEGAQGLKLDMDAGAFPYVTRSNTGLQNVAHLLQGIDREVNVHYMTLAYRTRHGAGPLQHEGKPLPKVSDLTNFKNEFQGSLRFAPLDIDELLSDIMRDVSLHSNGLQAKHHVCVTCMDQLNNGSVDVVLNGKVETMQHSRMLAELNRLPSLNLLAVSNGPAAKDIEYV
jgi:adenylosuccinate synthase